MPPGAVHNMLLIEIDHIQIAAPKGCEEVARFFFGSLLKLEEIEKPEALRARGGCWFRVGSRQLHIGVEEDFRPARKAHVAFAVPKDEIEQVFVRLTMDGVPCQWDNAIDGIRRFYTSDPWGNRLEFTEPTYESISDPAGIRFRSLRASADDVSVFACVPPLK